VVDYTAEVVLGSTLGYFRTQVLVLHKSTVAPGRRVPPASTPALPARRRAPVESGRQVPGNQ